MKSFTTRAVLLALPALLIATSALYAQTPIDQWGKIGTRLDASNWTLNNDESTPAGDAYTSGEETSSNWTAVRGGFEPITATTEEALVVSGQLEIVGTADLDNWNPLRFGVFDHRDIGELVNQNTDSAAWGYIQNEGTDSAAFFSNEAMAYGYMFSNQTAANETISGQGGIGIAWAINGGSWISTWSGGTMALGYFNHAPRRAVMSPGIYDFAMSVQPMADGSSEVRWYLVHEDGVSYWHAGTHTDTTEAKTVFNGFAFSYQNAIEGVTEMNLMGVQAGLGDAIEIPEKPFSSFYVDAWGALGTRLDATTWSLDNDSTTLVGDAYLSGDSTSSNWTAIRGGFGESVEATMEEALIVTGELEILGTADLDNWNPLRFGLFQHEDAGTLHYQFTPDAIWGDSINTGTDSAAFVSNEADAYGYLFTNQTAANETISGQGGIGIAWAINGGSWISTWSGGTMALGYYNHAPRRAVMMPGVYEFAMSVQPMADGSNEVRWYLAHEDGESYWHAGTHIDTTMAKTEFNGFAFSYQNAIEGVTGMNLYAVEVDRGAAIEIPEKPFSSFYVDAWGAIGTRLEATTWSLDNDSTTLVGDAYLSGDSTSSNWTAIRGGFGESVSATADEALIVSGELEILGTADLDNWNPLRFGVFQHEDIGSLHYQFTPDAIWGDSINTGTDSAAFVSNEAMAYGYLITNQTAANESISGQGGIGVGWAVNGGSWISTWSGGTDAMGYVNQAPRRAVMVPGLYEFEMSVQPLADGTTEFRWYLVHEDGETYWHAGTHIDTTMQKTDFNGFAFSYQNAVEGVTGMNLFAVEVDRGAAIEIPEMPFSPFYVDQWGFLGGKFGGAEGDTAWSLVPGELVGDVTIGGEAATGWASVAGSFGAAFAPSDMALTISGDVSLTDGGFEDDNSFRFGVFTQDLGSQDSTMTAGYAWSGEETGSGYLFVPGNNTAGAPAWADGTMGTAGGVAGGAWYDFAADGAYGLAEGTSTGTPSAGTYEFMIKLGPTEDGMGVRAKLEKDDGSYTYEAVAVDASAANLAKALATSSFNSVVFATNNSATTELKVEALEVTMEEFSPVAIEDQIDGTLPEVFALEQNYPNPFNPSTMIKFSLPEAADVQLEVFNMLGQRVMTLVNNSMQPGFHQVTFDAGTLASGMYVYRMKAGDFVSTRKMMLIE